MQRLEVSGAVRPIYGSYIWVVRRQMVKEETRLCCHLHSFSPNKNQSSSTLCPAPWTSPKLIRISQELPKSATTDHKARVG